MYVDTVDKSCLQQIIIYSMLCMLTLSIQSNYVVHSNTQYLKLQLKALTVFELTKHFKHEMVGIWQRFHINF